mmetsp:Transcript_5504/g.13292  ORF Transcript_5504/g.13292 Transcript_5504/m.13292 type:complete len:489 (+) Transcript_5504:855-2321(+)
MWVHKAVIETSFSKGSHVKGLRELSDGSLGISIGDDQSVSHSLCRTSQGVLLQMSLPFEGKRMMNLKIVPNEPSRPLLVLVARRDENECAWDMEMSMLSGSSENAASHKPIQLWRCDETNVTRQQISTRGNIPDFRSMFHEPGVASLNGHVVLLGSYMSIVSLLMQNDIKTSNPSAVFLLDMEAMTWRCLNHPYNMVDFRGQPCGPATSSLPLFLGLASCHLKERKSDMIILLREGNSLINEQEDNEIIPKYVVDCLMEQSRHDRPTQMEYGWFLNVQTTDRSGYVSGNVESVQIGSSLLVLGLDTRMSIIRKLNPETQAVTIPSGFCEKSSREPSVNLLDLDTMEWRKPLIRNSWLFKSDTRGGVVFSSSTDTCQVVVTAENRLHFLAIQNASKIESCVERPVSNDKLKSKKNTLSYQVKKGAKSKSQPFLYCAACGMFEAPGIPPFMWCSRFRLAAYCSRSCQLNHWKKSGGNQKELCAPLAEKQT